MLTQTEFNQKKFTIQKFLNKYKRNVHNQISKWCLLNSCIIIVSKLLILKTALRLLPQPVKGYNCNRLLNGGIN